MKLRSALLGTFISISPVAAIAQPAIGRWH
ncbi:hypothetical protein QFZ34_001480 [Phyllobacterium ifriqiyense]|uniref:Uncharacterized protein n=1 Tax=Phyllobacterium ifriqiyense TaxID=314238 RepID=A0ABU0S6B6_9HYPH|nr:hypothetical protein [Phyllobacterium ifriqiyense]